jgi:pyrroline-5-carboxylate reductase
MKELGLIGFGSMGRMLVEGFLTSRAAASSVVVVSTRTIGKLSGLEGTWPGIEIGRNNGELAAKCKRIIICVKPQEVKPVLEEISGHLRDDTHIVSIAACVTLGDIERIHRGKVTKVIPSLTGQVHEGISLVCHNGRVNAEEAAFVEKLFGSISTVKIVREEDFEAAADLTSCAPGLIAAMFHEFVESGVRHSGLTRGEAEEMAVKTLYGTAKLLKERGMKFEEAIARVATKGGITEEGVKVLQNRLPAVFDEMFKSTLEKHENRKKTIRAQFGRA